MTILDSILDTKRKEVQAARKLAPPAVVRAAAAKAPPARPFLPALQTRSPAGIQLIAEIKRRSPSAGEIVADFDPVRLARTFESCGAAALSILTDATYFGGSIDFLAQIRNEVSIPLLRKEFIIDEYQVFESRARGADAILLIAEAIGVEAVAHMSEVAAGLGLGVLVEVHTSANLQSVVARLGPPGESYILGINNRDLAAQTTSLETTISLAKQLPPSAPFVAESGIATRADVELIIGCGACAMLVGEHLLRAQDIGTKINELLRR